MGNACAGADPLQAFGFRETNSSMFPLYFRRTEACFIPRRIISSPCQQRNILVALVPIFVAPIQECK
jgi:hypothetical protein